MLDVDSVVNHTIRDVSSKFPVFEKLMKIFAHIAINQMDVAVIMSSSIINLKIEDI